MNPDNTPRPLMELIRSRHHKNVCESLICDPIEAHSGLWAKLFLEVYDGVTIEEIFIKHTIETPAYSYIISHRTDMAFTPPDCKTMIIFVRRIPSMEHTTFHNVLRGTISHDEKVGDGHGE